MVLPGLNQRASRECNAPNSLDDYIIAVRCESGGRRLLQATPARYRARRSPAGGSKRSVFPQASEDYFHDMDGGVAFDADEIKGRNMWLVWTGGNDRLWNLMTDYTLGSFDLLKILSFAPEPRIFAIQPLGLSWSGKRALFETPTGPVKDRAGLWLDVRSKGCAPDPFENESRYPGVAIGARGKPLGDGTTQPVGSYFGYASGVVGLRCVPQSRFRCEGGEGVGPGALLHRSHLLQPRGLGAPVPGRNACGFCHVGPSPVIFRPTRSTRRMPT